MRWLVKPPGVKGLSACGAGQHGLRRRAARESAAHAAGIAASGIQAMGGPGRFARPGCSPPSRKAPGRIQRTARWFKVPVAAALAQRGLRTEELWPLGGAGRHCRRLWYLAETGPTGSLRQWVLPAADRQDRIKSNANHAKRPRTGLGPGGGRVKNPMSCKTFPTTPATRTTRNDPQRGPHYPWASALRLPFMTHRDGSASWR